MALLLAAGCAGQTVDGGAAPSPTKAAPAPVNLVRDGYHGRLRVQATVLQNAQHGPQLCQAVAESLPPQCGGPDIAGWNWGAVRHDSAQGSKWGIYLLIGTFDGKTFTLTEPAKAPDDNATPSAVTTPDFTSPCPPPADGWKPVDPAKATDEALNQANMLASQDPDFGGLWIDQPVPVADPTPRNDPQQLVLNATFTRDLARHEAELREVWGGALCVSQARHTEAELRRIQDELIREPGVVSSSIDVTTGTVTVEVFLALQSRQRDLDAKYGTGLVRLQGVMQPLN
jgi:hypothetical protein